MLFCLLLCYPYYCCCFYDCYIHILVLISSMIYIISIILSGGLPNALQCFWKKKSSQISFLLVLSGTVLLLGICTVYNMVCTINHETNCIQYVALLQFSIKAMNHRNWRFEVDILLYPLTPDDRCRRHRARDLLYRILWVCGNSCVFHTVLFSCYIVCSPIYSYVVEQRGQYHIIYICV